MPNVHNRSRDRHPIFTSWSHRHYQRLFISQNTQGPEVARCIRAPFMMPQMSAILKTSGFPPCISRRQNGIELFKFKLFYGMAFTWGSDYVELQKICHTARNFHTSQLLSVFHILTVLLKFKWHNFVDSSLQLAHSKIPILFKLRRALV